MFLRRAFVAVVSLLLAALAMAADTTTANGASDGPARPATTVYVDPAGDSKGAPEITFVTVDDEYTTGKIVIGVTASPYPADGDSSITVWLDTDQNGSTGGRYGTEWAFAAGLDKTGYWWSVARWNGSKWESVPQSATMGFDLVNGVSTWTFNKADIGSPTGFNFYAVSVLWSAQNPDASRDRAPNIGIGMWNYQLSEPPPPPPPLEPVIGKPTAVPARAVAGKRFAVSFRVTRSDTGAPLTSGRMICDPSIAAKVLRHAESFKAGTARLSFTIPKTAKGKLLKVKLTIRAGTESATRVTTFRIR